MLVVVSALLETTDSTRSLGALVVVVVAGNEGAATTLNVSSSCGEPQLVITTTAGTK